MKAKDLLSSLILILFTFNVVSQNWYRVKKFDDPTGSNSSALGDAVCISGQVAVAGDEMSDRIYIFKLDLGEWVQTDMIQSELNTLFGTSVCISNDQVFVGARYKDDMPIHACGAVYIYDLDPATGKLSFNSILLANDRDDIDFFGCSISVKNNLAIIGAYDKENMVGVKTGAAYIFEKSGGSWIQKQKITASNGLFGDKYGSEVSTDGNLIAVSSVCSDNNSFTDAGSVYIYSYSFLTNSASEQQIIYSPDPKNKGNMGRSLKLFNNNLLIGSTSITGSGASIGKVFCYNINSNNLFEKYRTLMGDAAGTFGDEFGWSLCFDNESLVIGAPSENNSKGCIYYYHYINSDWEFFQKEKNSCYNENSLNFGIDVSLNGNSSIIGKSLVSYTPGKTKAIENAAIYFYKRGTSLLINAGDDRTICLGDDVLIGGYPTANGGVPPYIYNWTTNMGQVSTLSNFNVAPTTTTTYYLEVKDQISGCTSLKDQVTITVLPNCPCQYPVYINGIQNPSAIPLKNSAVRSIAIANRPTSSGAIAVTGLLETNVLTITNGYSRTHPQPGYKQFICKLNNKGYTQWSHLMECGITAYSTINPASCHVLFSDNMENTYLAQNFKNDVIFEDNTKIKGITNSSYWNQSIYFVKFDPSGNILWYRTIIDNNGQMADFFDMAISTDAIYIMGSTMSGFSFAGNNYFPGNFLLKINLVGEFKWCKQDYQGANCYITIDENNRIFIQTSTFPNKVYEINPVTGGFMPNYDKTSYLNTSLISFNSGGYGMFYEVLPDPTYVTNMAIRGYKFENVGSTLKFNYKKSIEAPHKDIQGMSAVGNMIYFRKVTADDFPDKFRKVDMLILPPNNDVLWTQNTSNLSCIRPSTRSNLTYGYFVAADFTHNNDFIINSFKLSDGTLGGCPLGKSFTTDESKISLPTEINKSFEVFPNPSKDILYLRKLNDEYLRSVKIEGFNSFGQKVMEKQATFQNNNNIDIDISKLPLGIYFLRISSGVSDAETFKVIKE